jgi:serine/threonine protein kinase
VRNHLDEREYAVKRVVNIGNDHNDLQIVLREVQCLAACTDHPNVVRYYTSWLEPSWMTNGTSKNAGIPMNEGETSTTGVSIDTSASNHHLGYFSTNNGAMVVRKKTAMDDSCIRSYGHNTNSSFWSEEEEDDDDDNVSVEEWSVARDDSTIFERSRSAATTPVPPQPSYRHQICLFIQMELCHPTTLADWLDQRTDEQVCLTAALNIFGNIVDGLAHVHAQHIVHRDLKPSNVFWNGTMFQIGDFGLSKKKKQQEKRSPTNRQHHRLNTDSLLPPLPVGDFTAGVGTASYASPEQITGCHYGTEADMFSLGLILLELCCNFTTAHERLLSFQSLRQKRIVPHELQHCHSAIASVILQCTERDPKLRPTAAELKDVSLYEEDEVNRLRRQLLDTRRELVACKSTLATKDQIIQRLEDQVATLQRPVVMPLLIQAYEGDEPASSSDSSDGGV